MQSKTNTMASLSEQFRLKISARKPKHFWMNNRFDAAITINGEAIEDVEHFTSLGSKWRC